MTKAEKIKNRAWADIEELENSHCMRCEGSGLECENCYIAATIKRIEKEANLDIEKVLVH